MLDVRLAASHIAPDALALPVVGPNAGTDTDTAARRDAVADAVPGTLPGAALLPTPCVVEETVRAEVDAFLRDVGHDGCAGVVHTLPRPLRSPARLLLVGVGRQSESDWRAAGAAVARAARRDSTVTIGMPEGESTSVAGFAEGLWLAAYRFRLVPSPGGEEEAPTLKTVTIVVDDPARHEAALRVARVVAAATIEARDLTNLPSDRKTPARLARHVERAAHGTGLTATVRGTDWLAAEGFGGLLAVGSASAHPPCLVELCWRPPDARTHVVLVGKGVTFDTGGISIKPREGMKLMRKDMGGAAAVAAVAVAVAALGLPLRVTAVIPLAENAVGGGALRPGDVIRHHGGISTEVLNTDAEGRLILADALAYAARRLEPDVVVDLATLTGAQGVALGKRTAALFSGDDALAGALAEAADAAGESVWRLPLVDDYVEALGSEVADLANVADVGAGAVLAALYLREFTGTARSRWAHLDMSAPVWSESSDGALSKGATGWGVRTLTRWLAGLAS